MCCFFGKGRICLARCWHSILYLCIAFIAICGYLSLSIAFYIECYALNKESEFAFQCGSNAMWSCMGWVPLFFFIVICCLTYYYLYKQATSTMKVLTSSDAWLILFVAIACCVLFFIHICYLVYVYVKLLDNVGCDPSNELFDFYGYVDCKLAQDLMISLLFFSILLILFICTSLTLLFALVNGRISTTVNYKTVKNKNNEQISDNDFDSDDNGNGENEENKKRNLAQFGLGQRVLVRLAYDSNKACKGTVRWFGHVKSTEYPTESTTSLPFLYGVHLDEQVGNCDGSIRGKSKRPFKCPMGFGIFVPINHIQKLDDSQENKANITIVRDGDAGSKKSNRQSINKGLIISRGDNPNHLFQGDLFCFLKKNIRLKGMLKAVKIGSIDNSNKSQTIKTQSMISIIFPTTNECIYNYLPLLSEHSEYDSIFFPERNIQKRERQSYDHDEKEKERDLNMPMVNLWYLCLHESWSNYSNKIKVFGVRDYKSSQWVQQSRNRALEWYALLKISKKESLSQSKVRFDAAPLPLFYAHKQKEANEDEMKLNSEKSKNQNTKSSAFDSISCHYVPLGMFHNKQNHKKQHKVQWLEASPFAKLKIRKNKKMSFRLKRLIHEPIKKIKCILPYLNSQSYKIDESDKKFGWFPIDWVYAEIDFLDNDIEESFLRCFRNYKPPLVDDENAYNPFWFMRFPRIPLFVLSVRLPLNALRSYSVQLVHEKYGHPIINRSITLPLNERSKKIKIPRPKSSKNAFDENEDEINNDLRQIEMERFERKKYKKKEKRSKKFKGSRQEYTYVASKDFEEESDAMSESQSEEYEEDESEYEEDDSESESDSEYEDDSVEPEEDETDSSDSEEQDGTVTTYNNKKMKSSLKHPDKHRNSSKHAPARSNRKPPKMRLPK